MTAQTSSVQHAPWGQHFSFDYPIYYYLLYHWRTVFFIYLFIIFSLRKYYSDIQESIFFLIPPPHTLLR